MGAMALEGSSGSLVHHMDNESDEATRVVMAAGLADSSAAGMIATSTLVRRIRAGAPDAALCALAFATRTLDDPKMTVDELVASPDPVLRTQVMIGLGSNEAPEVVGRLARAYSLEVDAVVRRAIVRSLAARLRSEESAFDRLTLETAARLDPDAIVRTAARRALERAPLPSTAPYREVAWVLMAPAEGASLPSDETGLFVREDGLAMPFAFDGDGYALVIGVPPGGGTVRLAPRLPAYSAQGP
jgi:hypothetical protein